jgi:hypothetical protein
VSHMGLMVLYSVLFIACLTFWFMQHLLAGRGQKVCLKLVCSNYTSIQRILCIRMRIFVSPFPGIRISNLLVVTHMFIIFI